MRFCLSNPCLGYPRSASVAQDQLREIDAASSHVVLSPTLLARLPLPFVAGFVDARSRIRACRSKNCSLSRLPVSPDDYDALSEIVSALTRSLSTV